MHPLVSATWLLEHLNDPNLRIADCRFTLGEPQAGSLAYAAGHLPGAVFLDLERDLSGPVGPTGGRHPLPDPGTLASRLGSHGIGGEHLVVAYDDSGGMFAPRLWWLLRWLGHDQVAVLDGGMSAYLAAGGSLTTTVPQHAPARLSVRLRPELVASAEDVARRPAGAVLVDSRATPRYRGEVEPIDPVAGHIPGAINRDWAGAVGPDGRFLQPEALQERLAPLLEAPDAIVYCGSGVSAAANALAVEVAGLRSPDLPPLRLYAGSWSDWITDPAHPVARGDE
jgi:thiosulfate/3-mercaptopyruvate sulfurtransferase